jgi:uncharacterized protein (TIGR00297 family)
LIDAILTHAAPPLLLLVGAPAHLIGATVAFWRRSTDEGAAAVGAVLGTVVFVTAGPLLWLLFAAFVLSSTAFTRFRATEKERFAAIHEKGARRDMVQVLANGGVAMAMAILLRITKEQQFAFAFAASVASANADTWASEIGELSRRTPVSPLTFRHVPPGTSGGVTLLGLSASLGGAILIAFLFALINATAVRDLPDLLYPAGCTTAAGFFGSLVDSVLGCTVQARYTAPDGSATERRTTKGIPNSLSHGLPLITNDLVNFLTTLAAAGAGALLASLR